MHKVVKVDKKKEFSRITSSKESELSEKFKADLNRVREEVKKGKFSRYKNSKELATELGL